MPEMKTLNGYEIVDAKARQDIANIEIPDTSSFITETALEGYATEQYVTDAIANIDIPESGGGAASNSYVFNTTLTDEDKAKIQEILADQTQLWDLYIKVSGDISKVIYIDYVSDSKMILWVYNPGQNHFRGYTASTTATTLVAWNINNLPAGWSCTNDWSNGSLYNATEIYIFMKSQAVSDAYQYSYVKFPEQYVLGNYTYVRFPFAHHAVNGSYEMPCWKYDGMNINIYTDAGNSSSSLYEDLAIYYKV